MKEKYSPNYIYQIKHTIRKKVSWMIEDVELAMKSDVIKTSFTDNLLETMVTTALRREAHLIRNVLKIRGLGSYIHVEVPYYSKSIGDLLFDAYKLKPKLLGEMFERVRKRLDEYWKDLREKNERKKLKAKLELEQRILTEYINTRKLDDFLEILKEKRIDMVIDVRWNTLNKSKEGFNPENLRQFLAENGIEYKYIHKLGNPSKFRKETENFLKLKEKYIGYIRDLEDLEKLVKLVNDNKKVYCFICYCETVDEEKCHRFWLREYILSNEGIYIYGK